MRCVRHLIVRDLDEAGREPALAGEQSHERRRAARGAVERDLRHLVPGHLAHQHHREHVAGAGDRHPRHRSQRRVGLQLDLAVGRRGDEREIDVARRQPRRAPARQVELQREAGFAALAELLLEAVGDGTRVEKGHRRQPHGSPRVTAGVAAKGAHEGTTSRLLRTSRRNGLVPPSASPSATTLYRVSRSTGSRPAVRISRTISAGVMACGVSAPAM